VAFARKNGLNLFASPSTVDRYLRAGLPYQANSLMTTVVVPGDGATVKGVVPLIAAAQSDFGIMKVDFEIAALSGGRPVGVSAINTSYGWLAEWDSTRLPNGQYTIQSVAYDHASHRAESAPIVVRVKD
jgi:Bacterial Ig domain